MSDTTIKLIAIIYSIGCILCIPVGLMVGGTIQTILLFAFFLPFPLAMIYSALAGAWEIFKKGNYKEW